MTQNRPNVTNETGSRHASQPDTNNSGSNGVTENADSSVDNHTQATLNADRLALRRQQDTEYANALAEDLAHQRLTEQEGEENPVDMNAIRAARLERFAPTHVDELSSEPPTDTHSRRHNRQHSQQLTDTNAEWQREAASEATQPRAPSGVNAIPLVTRTDADTSAEWGRGTATGANTIPLGTRTDANTSAEQQRGEASGANTIPLGTRTDTNTNAEQQRGTASGANTIPIGTRAGTNTDVAQRFLGEMWHTLTRDHTGGS